MFIFKFIPSKSVAFISLQVSYKLTRMNTLVNQFMKAGIHWLIHWQYSRQTASWVRYACKHL